VTCVRDGTAWLCVQVQTTASCHSTRPRRSPWSAWRLGSSCGAPTTLCGPSRASRGRWGLLSRRLETREHRRHRRWL